MYAYNTQFYSSKNQAPFSLVLSPHPSVPILLQSNDVVPSDVSGEATSQILRACLEVRIRTMQTRVDAHDRKSIQQYNNDYDRRICETSIQKLGENIFLDRPPLTVTKDQDAYQPATNAHKRFLLRSTGPFCIISVQPHTATIDEHGIENSVTNDRVVLELAMQRYSPIDRA